MKKVISLILISLIVITMMTSVYASSYKTELKASKNEINPSEEFTVDVNLSNVQDDSGLITITGTVKYDKNALTLVKLEKQGNWTDPVYNEANGKFVTDRNGPTTSNEAIFKATFKANDNASGETAVSIEAIEASNGATDIKTDNVSTTIKIGKQTTPVNNTTVENTTKDPVKNETLQNLVKDPSNNTTKNNVTNNTTNKISTKNNTVDNDTVKKGVLPKAGDASLVLTLVGILLVLVVVFYIRFEVITNKINKSGK